MQFWTKIFEELDARLVEAADQQFQAGSGGGGHAKVKILGQCALLTQPKMSSSLSPFQTRDLDALIEGSCREHLKFVLKKHGLEYDDLSKEIWLPRKAVFNTIFEGRRLTVEALDVISALVSKAVKAPDKNKILIRDAIKEFGPTLTNELEFYGVSREKFLTGTERER